MLRLIFCLSFLSGSFAFGAKPVAKKRSVQRAPSASGGSALQQFSIKMRYSAKSWTTPEEVIPPEFYDIPGEERSPNSSTDTELSIDDVYGANQDVPDYGENFKAEHETLEDALDY